MGQRKKKFSSYSFIFAFLLVFVGSAFATGLFVSKINQVTQQAPAAEAVSYMAWDDASKTVKSVEGGCTEYTVVTDSTTSWSTGWYVVNSEVEINNRISVSGTANLILCDGATLTANDGISVNNGNTLYIYGQSEGTGSIIATAKSNRIAGIGGNGDTACGTIFIHGGTITATGPNKTPGAGIGGGNGGDGGNITIYGGNITANGGKYSAAIGGGYTRGAGTITIYGGNIDANGGPQGAGLGCAADMGTNHPGGTITIHGGIINATGGVYAAGIGGSLDDPAVTITINGGDITAIGGANAAGISGGYRSSVGTVTINDGKVFATGGGNGAYGIGNGSEATNDGTLIVSNNDLNVLGNDSETPIFPRDAKTATEYQFHGWKYMTVTSAANVTFNTNDGTINSDDFNVYGEGIVTPLPTNVTKTDYVFGGWYTDSALTEGPVTEISADSRGALEYWAKWKESIPYYAWDEDSKTVKAVPGGCSEYTIVESTTTDWTDGKWYVVNSEVEINNRISLSGTANLILCDGCTLTANGGISVIEGNTLNIYAQSEGENAGNLIARTDSQVYHYAVIGGDYSDDYSKSHAGTINIHGGNIDVRTGGDDYGASIGGGMCGKAGNITIYGGDITVASYYGAAIGGGAYYTGTDGNITINGGKINAQCYGYGAGIGGGDNGSSGNIVINGGDITAVANRGGAGIGGGDYGAAETIIINNGSITAIGGYGAGIGSGSEGAGGTITINGGTIIARSRYTGAGIGGGQAGGGGIIVIKNGNITAYGGNGIGDYSQTAAGIGGGYNGAGANVTIYDGYITASGGIGSVGIGAGLNNTNHGTLTIVDETKLCVYGSNSSKLFPLIEKVDDDYERFTYMRVKFPHEHIWSYVAYGNTISATCSAEDCDVLEEARTLTLVAEDSIFDGTAKSSSFAPGYSAEAFANPTISYYKDGVEVEECINAGTYESRVTIGGVTAIKEFTIAQATPTGYDIPTGLVATYGDKLSSVALPTNWSWKVSTDEVGDVGDRTHVAIYTPTDSNYKAIEANIIISVAQATPTPDIPTDLEATYGDNLSSVTLPSDWAWKNPEDSVGNAGNREHNAIYTPTDPNYKSVEKTITVSVSQATPTPEAPTGLEATYGDSLSSVILPSGWAWKNPEDSVGDAGERVHVATFTPTDPNYKAKDENITIIVAKANPSYTLPTDIEIYINETVSSVTLPSGFSWMDESIKASSLGENTFKVRYTPVDTANYNVVDNIDLKVNVEWKVVDPSSSSASIEINDADEAYTTDISVKVEVKTDISVEQKRNEYASLATNDFVKSNEDIVEIYNVKLIRTTNGVEEEIQPSDIKTGTKITVSMAIPENLVGKEFRLIHIHNAEDISEITNYSVSKDGKTLAVEIDRLSEFAFIGATDKDNGFIYNSTPIWALILLIIFSIILLVGIYYLYRLIKDRNDNSNNKDKSVKTMSVTFISPVILAYSGLNGIIIAFIIVATLSVIVWASNLCLFISNKKKKEKLIDANNSIKNKEDVKLVEEAINDSNKDEIEVVTIKDEKGNVFNIRYIKSFLAKLIQSPAETKSYYEELKNEVLSYKGTHSRISWHFDSVNAGRNYVLKFAIRGKTLCLYLPLDADSFIDTKYKVEKVEAKKYQDVPCLYRIKNDRRLRYAKELIATVASNLGLSKGEEQHEIYSNLPYEENKPLIAKGLIKEQRVQVNKPKEEVVETKVNAEGDEIVITKDNKGNMFEIRYVKSFTAKLSQSPDETKGYYSDLKNYVLSYKGTHSRVSWHHDAINLGRDYIIKLAIRGKTLCVYFALDISKLESKYKVEEAKGKRFEEVPCLYRIKNNRRFEYAKELIDKLMNNLGIQRGKELNDEYRIPHEETKVLLAKGLIKEVKTKVTPKEVMESVSAEEADRLMSDVKAEASIEEDNIHHRRQGSKDIINIDTLSQNYNDGDEVTLDSLIEKKLISPKVGYVKVLGRGVLDKKLIVVLNDYSLQAVKMIVLTGGHVKKINN